MHYDFGRCSAISAYYCGTALHYNLKTRQFWPLQAISLERPKKLLEEHGWRKILKSASTCVLRYGLFSANFTGTLYN